MTKLSPVLLATPDRQLQFRHDPAPGSHRAGIPRAVPVLPGALVASGLLIAAGLLWVGAALGSVNAAWDIVPSPNPVGPQTNYLYSVACPSSRDCWAVGLSNSSTGWVSLIEHWDGSSWSVVTPPAGSDSTQLFGITCLSASDCWAVGDYSTTGNVYQTLIEHWNGTLWSIVHSDNTSGTENNELNGITCESVSDCWAVGFYVTTPPINSNETTVYQTLVEHWDGSSWSIVMSPNTLPVENNVLESATCISASDCWTVGYSRTSGVFQTLVERWDGASWTIVNSPNVNGAPFNILNSVRCTSASDCWAVGDYQMASTTVNLVSQTLIERWNGTSWNIVTSPNSSTTDGNFLQSMTCLSASDCWTVGAHNTDTVQQTLIEQWDGTSWAIVASPSNSDVQISQLLGVTCASKFDCWAVGFSGDGSTFQTLIEHYTAPPVTLNAVVSRKIHGTVGPFDVDLTNGNGVECRSGGATGDYTVVFTFANALASVDGADVTSGTGTVASRAIDSSDLHNYIVNLTGVGNGQMVTLVLTNLTDSAGDFSPAIEGSMGVLLGDVNGSRRVDAADVSGIRQQTLQPVTTSNFRADVNASGRIDAADVSIARQQTLTFLP